MKIVIVGAGKVGYSLAEYFSRLNHNITIIEKDKGLCEEINSKLDVFAIESVGSNPQALEEANIEKADLLIAVTPSDETNLLVCNFAMQNGVKRRIARVKSNLFTGDTGCVNISELGVTTLIEPEREVVKRLLQYVELPGVTETANLHNDSIYLRGYQVKADMPIAGKTLAEIGQMEFTQNILFVVIVRKGESIHPAGSETILPGDKIVAIMPKESFPAFLSLIGKKPAKMEKIIVSGDTLTAIHLAEALKPISEQVILANPDKEHGLMAASRLDGVDVFHVDSTNGEMLEEINIKETDCFIASGKHAEDNVMSCLLAKAEGAKMVIALREDKRYEGLFSVLGMDHIIYEQEITLDAIIEKIQMVSIGAHLKLKTSNLEILRLRIQDSNSVAGKSLKELEKVFKKSLTVGCVVRGDNFIIPSGDTVLEVNDYVLILSHKKDLPLVKKIFKPID